MENQLPEWASDKEKEGMKAFLEIVEEYGQFTVEFKASKFPEDVGFEASVSWGRFDRGDISIPFSIFWNYDQLFNQLNEKVDTWQFVICDSGFTISSQLFYMELFQRVDEKLTLPQISTEKAKPKQNDCIFEIGKPIPTAWMHMELDFIDTQKYLGGVAIKDKEELERLVAKYLQPATNVVASTKMPTPTNKTGIS